MDDNNSFIQMEFSALDNLEYALFRAMRRLQHAGEVHAKRLGRFGGMNPMHLLILQVLASEGRLTASTLSGRVSLSPATLSGIIERLEELGLLVRQRDESDRRRHWLLLSQAGADLLQQAPSLLPPSMAQAFAALPEWERHSLTAALLKAADLCGEMDA
ncbi:DNA-binding transcriptional regulator, MarR family [Pseudomonas pohangensis]|jgi:DNA-binding MarR family transcriptional regulator|uniref:DNA-binding transcriptional regulator, MarR family n=2 Tax=Pseudomonas pohangensis TaxID=364197 RepID=A0A1H2I1W0_9PSED|nr:DNA-binding transcriptional regulator, MarR family [Pseudomonas pohangensis]